MVTFERYPEGDFLGFEDLLTDAERSKLQAVREWGRTEVYPIAVDHWNRSAFPHQLLPQIAELDIMSSVERHGFSHLAAGLITAEIHRNDASVGTFMSGQDSLFTRAIELLASDEQKAEWLPEIYDIKKTGVFAITEPKKGSDVAGGLETVAKLEGDHYVLNGHKRWIGNATFSDYVLVFACDDADGQVKGFLVDTSAEGYRAELMDKRIALRAVQNANVYLDNVKVPVSHKLEFANSFRDVNKVFVHARATAGWQAVGLQRAALDLVREHVVTREQFGKKLGEFQLVQEHVATILGNLSLSTSIMARISQLQDAGLAKGEHTALAKAQTSKLMRDSVARARGVLGGDAIETTQVIGKVFCDAEAIYTYEGTYEINQLIAGRSITGLSAFV
ncbi:acyl-CoA dehydrogenase family protein [Gulosibacter bifidus]|uniref:Acyl-CoA dehydrogenase family protein n=1 Tax=Gulosibacter bifidus TaxID=272239 RepID=A0ABW5RKT0_9MICO|nr:acyl-CoA dehydrogenase family protein [Gulosibacter bifidus]